MEPSRWTSPPESRSQQLLLKVVPFKMVFTPVAVEALEGLVSTEERAEQNRISEGNTPPTPPTKTNRIFRAYSEQIHPSEPRKAKQLR